MPDAVSSSPTFVSRLLPGLGGFVHGARYSKNSNGKGFRRRVVVDS